MFLNSLCFFLSGEITAPLSPIGNKSSLHGRQPEAKPVEEEFGDFYDDVELQSSEQNKRVSLM